MVFASTNEFDIKKRLDMTGVTSVTASRLNQLVDTATVSTNKGMVIGQFATPDVANNPRYSNFLWLDYNYTPPKVKFYSPTALVWTEIGTSTTVADGSVTTAKFADGSVTTIKIATGNVTSNSILAASINNSKLADISVTSNKTAPGIVFSPDSLSFYVVQQSNINMATFMIGATNLNTNLVIGGYLSNYSVGGEKIATNTITTTNIADLTITTNDISTNIYQMLPKVWAVCTSNSIVRQAGTITLTHAGHGTNNTYNCWAALTFSPTLAGTNYGVIATPILYNMSGIGGNMYGQATSYVSNTTSGVTLVWTDGGAGGFRFPLGFTVQIFDNQ